MTQDDSFRDLPRHRGKEHEPAKPLGVSDRRTHNRAIRREFAIRFLREAKLTANEFFRGFSLTKFDGEQITW